MKDKYEVLGVQVRADACMQVRQQYSTSERTIIRPVVIVSAAVGSHMVVRKKVWSDQPTNEVISISTY
ncbi:opine metallophore biosynthesis dehydrogenase [Staphylococcus pseudintermedius]|uniref:opine metallophore biosynthesis dehydrogenase n=1 Tax=Staphylococcus pseudintermedius TaxID=283734 RepID=UPI0034E0A4F2